MELIGLKKCSTCREVERLLEAQGLTYHYREINDGFIGFDSFCVGKE